MGKLIHLPGRKQGRTKAIAQLLADTTDEEYIDVVDGRGSHRRIPVSPPPSRLERAEDSLTHTLLRHWARRHQLP